jgi:polar amino acid transport system substrate-binding protein
MRYRIAAAVLLGILFIAVVLYLAASPNDTSLARLQQNQVIRIGYAIEAPYAFIASDGSITGESPEVAKAIAAALGIAHVQWVQTDFDSLITDLLDHRFDVIAAGMYITPARAQRIRFSNPSFHVRPGLLVRAGNPLRLHSYQDIVSSPAATIAVLSGSVEENYLLKAGVAESRLVKVPDALTGLTTVTSRLADGLALSSVTVRWMTAHDTTGATEVADPFDATAFDPSWGYGGFGFRPQDRQLADAWNVALAAFIGSAEHLQRVSPLGFTPDELPGSMTAERVLSYEH